MDDHEKQSAQLPLPGLPENGLLRARQIHTLLGIGLSTWWLWVKNGKAPKGIRLSSRTTVWRVQDINALIENLAENTSLGGE